MQSKMLFRGAVFALLVLSLALSSTAQLAGDYTIDPAGSGSRNYTTFAAAAAALNAGITAPVKFTVASTTFNEAVILSSVTGVTATVRVRIVALGAPAVINAGAAVGMTLQAGSKYYDFENLKITGASTDGIYMASSRVEFCTFKNVEVDMPASTSTAINALDQQQARDITYENCKFAGGGRTFYAQGPYRCNFKGCEFDGKSMAAQVVNPWNANNSDCLFENCFIHDCGPSGYAIHVGYSGHGVMFWHNTIIATTSREAVLNQSCCAWTRANSFRNNIVINKGAGPCLSYGYNTSTFGGGPGLDFNDLDYNCYYHPNAGPTVQVQVISSSFPTLTKFNYSGNLAGFKTHFALHKTDPDFVVQRLNPSPALVDVFCDDNSIEADPGLVSDSPPYDIHLKGNSPCFNAGTTRYVPHTMITPFPLTYVVAKDFEGDIRPATNVDIGADEVAVSIVGSGSGSPGTAINFILFSPSDAGLPYQVGSSFGNGPIPIDTRKLELSGDNLLVLSTSGTLPMVFQNYAGLLDAGGNGAAVLNIPNIPQLKGLRIYTAFLTLKGSAPSGIANISASFLFTVQ